VYPPKKVASFIAHTRESLFGLNSSWRREKGNCSLWVLVGEIKIDSSPLNIAYKGITLPRLILRLIGHIHFVYVSRHRNLILWVKIPIVGLEVGRNDGVVVF
jgi:hypothetical protein